MAKFNIRIKEDQVPKKSKYGQTIKSDQKNINRVDKKEDNNFDELFKESCKKYSTSI